MIGCSVAFVPFHFSFASVCSFDGVNTTTIFGHPLQNPDCFSIGCRLHHRKFHDDPTFTQRCSRSSPMIAKVAPIYTFFSPFAHRIDRRYGRSSQTVPPPCLFPAFLASRCRSPYPPGSRQPVSSSGVTTRPVWNVGRWGL